MTWSDLMPKHGCNKTYFVQRIIEFRDELSQLNYTTYYYKLCGTNSAFQAVVESVRLWAEEITDNRGMYFSVANRLWDMTCWAHHSKTNKKYPHTDVTEEHMLETLNLMYTLQADLMSDQSSDDEDSITDEFENLSLEPTKAKCRKCGNIFKLSVKYEGDRNLAKCFNCRK